VRDLTEDAVLARLDLEDKAAKAQRYGEFRYDAKSWKCERRVIARIEVSRWRQPENEENMNDLSLITCASKARENPSSDTKPALQCDRPCRQLDGANWKPPGKSPYSCWTRLRSCRPP
jgi:hypothetical protein